MTDRPNNILYAALGVAGVGVAAYLRQRSAKRALGDVIEQARRSNMMQNLNRHPLLQGALDQLGEEAVNRLMDESDPEDPFGPKVIRMARPTQASQMHDTTIPIKDAEFTPIPED